jgi:hypothetical protein
MKFLLPCFLLAAFFSTNAFATHAYRSENCKSQTHELNYKGNYPVGGMYGVSLLGQEEDDTPALPLYDASETPNSLEDADVIFTEGDSKILSQKPTSHDCYFDHDEWTSEKTIEVNLISPEAAKKLGLKQGDKMVFTCEESTDYPNGKDCE